MDKRDYADELDAVLESLCCVFNRLVEASSYEDKEFGFVWSAELKLVTRVVELLCYTSSIG